MKRIPILIAIILIVALSAPANAAPLDQQLMCDDYSLLVGSVTSVNVAEMGRAGSNNYTHYTLISSSGGPTVILEYGDPSGPGTYTWYPEVTVGGNGVLVSGHDQQPQYYNYLHRIRFSSEDTYPPLRSATVRACYEKIAPPTSQPAPTSTNDPTRTSTPTSVPTNTRTSTPTSVPTNTRTATNTRTPTSVLTNTRTSTPANTSTATRTRTPTTTPDAAGCRTIAVSGSTVINFSVGTVITATGSVEYGGQYGMSWQAVPSSGGILIPTTSTYYFRGAGSVYACTSPTPTVTGTPAPLGCYLVTIDDYIYGIQVGYMSHDGNAPYQRFDIEGLRAMGVTFFANTHRLWSSTNPNGVGGYYVYPPNELTRRYNDADYFQDTPKILACNAPIPTPTITSTPTGAPPTTTRTALPPTTRTPLPTRTPAPPTATGLPTATNYPTPPAGLCVQTQIAVGETISLSIASGAYLRSLNGVAVAQGDQANYNVGAGGLIWPEPDGSYPFTGISISDGGMEIVIEICPVGGEPSTPTTQPQATATPGGAGSGLPPTALSGMPGYVPPVLAPGATLGPMPDLQIHVPTLRPRPATATALIYNSEITITVVLSGVSTMQAGLETPLSVIETASAGYSYASGLQTGQEFTVMMQPAMGWVAVLNPRHPGWTQRCGPLYAIAPVVLPLAPIIIISLVLALLRFFIWVAAWVLRLADAVFQVLQVIRG